MLYLFSLKSINALFLTFKCPTLTIRRIIMYIGSFIHNALYKQAEQTIHLMKLLVYITRFLGLITVFVSLTSSFIH